MAEREEPRSERREHEAPKKKGALGGKWHGVPVPVLVIGLAAGGYLLYRWYQNRSTSSTTATAPASTQGATSSGTGGLDPFAGTGSSGGGGGGYVPPPYIPPVSTTAPAATSPATSAPSLGGGTTTPPTVTTGAAAPSPSPAGANTGPTLTGTKSSSAITAARASTNPNARFSASNPPPPLTTLGYKPSLGSGLLSNPGAAAYTPASKFNQQTARAGQYYYKDAAGQYQRYQPGKSRLPTHTQLYTMA